MNQVIAPVKNLLVIDSQVSDWQSLAAGVGTDTAVLILDSGSDGLTQISNYLTTLAASTPDFTPLQSLQIISHGSAGSLQLGSNTLTTDSLKQYASQLASIGSSLTATGDILLYGCNVAAGQNGLDFINLFSTLTNAEVAASNDVTGSAALGGDWLLEASTGSIEATAVLSSSTLNSYVGTLAAILPGVSVTAGITPQESGATGSFTFTLDSAPPAGGLTINYTLAGTATLSTDYSVTAGTNVTAVTGSSFTIAAGQTTATLAIKAVSDGIYDPNETINFTLAGGTGYVVSNVTGFAPKVDYATGIDPTSVSVGDFNGDGKTDLAVANWDSGTVSVLLRNAANTGFDPKVDYATGWSPRWVSVGDFNGDGKTDLAVANMNSSTVSVLLRNATNTGFDPTVDYSTSYPSSVCVGDFNGDGKIDLAVTSFDNTVSILLRNAANTGFDPKVGFATSSRPYSVSTGDFNGDGKTDLAVTNFNSDTVSVLLRNAANTGFDPKVDFATGWSPSSVSVGDFNGDGKIDLAVANLDSNVVSVLLRNAANTGFDPKVDLPTTGDFSGSVSVGDFNGDGKTDLAVTNGSSQTVSILLRNTANTGFDSKVDFATGIGPSSVSVGDFNGDGKTDLAVANGGNNTVSVLLNNSAVTASLTIADTSLMSGTNGDDIIYDTSSDDIINALAGNDNIYGSLGNDRIDGGTGNDTVLYDFNKSAITEVGHSSDGTLMIKSAEGTDTLLNIENLSFLDGGLSINELLAQSALVPLFTSSASDGTSGYVMPTKYAGPVTFLEYQLLGNVTGDVITGSTGNDFINLLGGDDAANGGAGSDVLDGGTGSNFLTGGSGNDTIFLDGRGGTTTWSTVTDFSAGDQVNIWGWNAGVSKQLFAMENQGADGYKGATFHYDLNNDGLIDTSITLTGLALSQVPAGVAHTVAGNGYLLIS